MKPSRYNRLLSLTDDRYLVFNCLSGVLAELDGAAAEPLLGAGTSGNPGELAEAGFVVEDDVDELEVYRHLWYGAQHDPSVVALLVCPTMECDMDCVYCFVDRDRTRMSRETAERLAAMVRDRLARARNLEVLWFGGEPLLALDLIEHLSERLMAAAAEAGCRYRAGMFTNGYGLGPDERRTLLGLGVRGVTIALDGPAPVHERRRPHVDRRPVFDRILENALAAAEDMEVTLRCAMDEDNEAAAWELHDFLAEAGYLQRLEFLPGRVTCDLDIQARRPPGMLTGVEYDRRLLRAIHARRGRLGFALPFPGLDFGCSYQRHNSIAVDASGYLYRCLKTVGRKDWAVGTVERPPDLDSPALARWLRIDPFRRDGCRECDILPVCGGGCAMAYFEDGRPRCSHLRVTLDDWLLLHAEWQE